MIRIEDRSECCGCSACAAVCPVQAISMRPDGMGFLYPVVDGRTCIGCGKCEEACTFRKDLRSGKPEGAPPRAWAARAREDSVLEGSSSGGAGFLLMDDFVSRGGVVYGARLDEGSRVVHSRAVTRDDILSFRTSKYAQSDPGDTFSRVSDDLSAGREVLFTGTPCQTAALRDLTGGAEGLYLADVFCHGVAAPAIWAAYLSREEDLQGQTVSSALFRDPAFGWSDSVCTVSFADGSRRSSREWARMYRKNLMVRPSCTRCPYACVNRPSDVSLGDCWGIGRSHPAFADGDKGCSLVLVHTSRGEALSESLSRRMERVPVPLKDFLQPSLCGPVQAVGEASAFERDFLSRGYAYARRRHVVPSLAERWRMLKWKVKCFLKRKGIWK